MKECPINQNYIETGLKIENKVDLAIEKVEKLSEEIATEMGDQWKIDRFGEYKSEHMKKMALESEEIIKDYELDKKDELVPYIPFFKFICRSHDLGRHFHDDKKYVDEKGKYLDHGEISILLLEKNETMSDFSDDEQKLIKYVVKNHSLKDMAEPTDDVEKKAQYFCQVFRDMDKLEVLNKRDYIRAKEIYRLLGIQFDLGEYKDEWKNTDKRESYIDFIQNLLNKKETKTVDGLEVKIKEIVDGPMQENVDDINIIDDFVAGKAMSMSVYKETKSYSNYLLYLFSYLNGIKYSQTLVNVDQEAVKDKMAFFKNRTTEKQYNQIKSVFTDKYGYKID